MFPVVVVHLSFAGLMKDLTLVHLLPDLCLSVVSLRWTPVVGSSLIVAAFHATAFASFPAVVASLLTAFVHFLRVAASLSTAFANFLRVAAFPVTAFASFPAVVASLSTAFVSFHRVAVSSSVAFVRFVAEVHQLVTAIACALHVDLAFLLERFSKEEERTVN